MPLTQVDRGWMDLCEGLPMVGRLLLNYYGDTASVTIKYRGEHDWLIIGKKFGDDGRPVVVFGSGSTAVDALRGLERAIDADKWRPDRYAK